ncbi:hypothetical protein JRQ81_016646 [Phrynocephalus forsythii]|uniref:Uncharacterized protein n=1 Tax=Phrynocephalus forsythii TaxID=171643 RepID=A0A9Q1B1I1_9SAUR|nr:hypothetical protein JRQ81_016646 [Phrynocephalus forsythii]
MIASESKTNLECKTQVWSDCLTKFGLHLIVKKMEYLMSDPNEYGTIQINDTDPPRTEKFKYLCSIITADGSLSYRLTSRTNSFWLKWCTISNIKCDKKISKGLKSKTYHTIIQTVEIYGAEC